MASAYDDFNANFKSFIIKKVERDDLFTLSEMDKYHFKEFAFGIFGFHKYLAEALIFEKIVLNEGKNIVHENQEGSELIDKSGEGYDEEVIAGYYILQEEIIKSGELNNLSKKSKQIFQKIKIMLKNFKIGNKEEHIDFYDDNEQRIHDHIIKYMRKQQKKPNSAKIYAYNEESLKKDLKTTKFEFRFLHLISILVGEAHQNNGLGTFLLNRIKNFALKCNFHGIFLEVYVENKKAIRFYENSEFKRCIRLKKYYNREKDAYLYIYLVDN